VPYDGRLVAGVGTLRHQNVRELSLCKVSSHPPCHAKTCAIQSKFVSAFTRFRVYRLVHLSWFIVGHPRGTSTSSMQHADVNDDLKKLIGDARAPPIMLL